MVKNCLMDAGVDFRLILLDPTLLGSFPWEVCKAGPTA
jgi:hypothetical protein